MLLEVFNNSPYEKGSKEGVKQKWWDKINSQML